MANLFRTLAASALGLVALSTPVSAKDDALQGDLRITGSEEFAPLLEVWGKAFERRNPGVRVIGNLKGSAAAIYGLEMRTADVALMVRPINPFERYGTYERAWIYPVEIEVATGSSVGASYGIFVHPDNPLRQLSMAQLDGIFGARRDGGWDKLAWNKAAARDESADIRTWRQLEVSGPLADLPIHVYGPPIDGQGVVSPFQKLVMDGGASWNEDYREVPGSAGLFAALVGDRQGIAYAPLAAAPAGFVPLALASRDGSGFVLPTRGSLADRGYPLALPAYLYFTRDTLSGDPAPVTPLIRAFARFVLSKEGQTLVTRDPHFLRLKAAAAADQLRKANSDAWPSERSRP